MTEFLIMFKNVLIFIALAIPGYWLTKKKALDGSSCQPLSQLLIYVAMPFLVFSSTLDISLTKQTVVEFLWVALITTAGQLGGCWISGFLSKSEKEPAQKGLMQFAMVFGNNGFLGLPLVVALFGSQMPLLVADFVIVGIITNLFILLMGGHLMAREQSAISLKTFLTNPVLIAFVCGVALNLCKVASFLPEVGTFATHLKNLVTPLSMIIIGIKFGEMRIGDLLQSKKLYYVALIRLILFPVMMTAILLVVRMFIPVGDRLILTTFIGFAMPTGALATSLAVKYNIPGNSATIYVLGTTLFSVITIPVLYFLLLLFL